MRKKNAFIIIAAIIILPILTDCHHKSNSKENQTLSENPKLAPTPQADNNAPPTALAAILPEMILPASETAFMPLEADIYQYQEGAGFDEENFNIHDIIGGSSCSNADRKRYICAHEIAVGMNNTSSITPKYSIAMKEIQCKNNIYTSGDKHYCKYACDAIEGCDIPCDPNNFHPECIDNSTARNCEKADSMFDENENYYINDTFSTDPQALCRIIQNRAILMKRCEALGAMAPIIKRYAGPYDPPIVHAVQTGCIRYKSDTVQIRERVREYIDSPFEETLDSYHQYIQKYGEDTMTPYTIPDIRSAVKVSEDISASCNPGEIGAIMPYYSDYHLREDNAQASACLRPISDAQDAEASPICRGDRLSIAPNLHMPAFIYNNREYIYASQYICAGRCNAEGTWCDAHGILAFDAEKPCTETCADSRGVSCTQICEARFGRGAQCRAAGSGAVLCRKSDI